MEFIVVIVFVILFLLSSDHDGIIGKDENFYGDF